LSVEEWFYLLFPLTIALLLALALRFGWKKSHTILLAILLFLAVPFVFRLATASQLEVDQFWLEVKVYKIVVLRLDAIAFGLLAAYWKRFYNESWKSWKVLSFVLGLVLIFGLMQFTWQPNAFDTKVLKVIYRGVGCMLILPLLDAWRTAPKWPLRIFTHISLISYSMYLINLALVSEVIRDNFPPQNEHEAWAMYAVYWTVTVGVSTLLFKYFESPLLNIRDRFASK
jgi:peptidoglycan/LPS O-acetylase OafA/YrhL